MGIFSDLYAIIKNMRNSAAQKRAFQARKERYKDDSDFNQLWNELLSTQKLLNDHIKSEHTPAATISNQIDINDPSFEGEIPASQVQSPPIPSLKQRRDIRKARRHELVHQVQEKA